MNRFTLDQRKDMRRIDSQIMADNYTFDTIKEFIYLGSAVTTKNDLTLRSNAGSLMPTGATMASMGN